MFMKSVVSLSSNDCPFCAVILEELDELAAWHGRYIVRTQNKEVKGDRGGCLIRGACELGELGLEERDDSGVLEE